MRAPWRKLVKAIVIWRLQAEANDYAHLAIQREREGDYPAGRALREKAQQCQWAADELLQ